MQPVLAVPFAIGVAKQAPHPYSALLFADYVLSPEGQEVLNEMGRLPASSKIKKNSVNFPYTVLDVNASLAESRTPSWLSSSVEDLEIRVVTMPTADEVSLPVNASSVVELLSR